MNLLEGLRRTLDILVFDGRMEEPQRIGIGQMREQTALLRGVVQNQLFRMTGRSKLHKHKHTHPHTYIHHSQRSASTLGQAALSLQYLPTPERIGDGDGETQAGSQQCAQADRQAGNQQRVGVRRKQLILPGGAGEEKLVSRVTHTQFCVCGLGDSRIHCTPGR